MVERVGVIGGDRRQSVLAELLVRDGYQVCTYGLGEWSDREAPLEEALTADVVILPLPLCWENGILNCAVGGISADILFAAMRPGTLVLAGQVRPEQQRQAAERELCLVDYFQREEMIVANAAATAEGAIRVAMQQMERTLLGADCLVIGFGRIGKLLSCRLHGLGCKVTAAARNPADLAWIDAFGWNALDIDHLNGNLSAFQVVFNTAPSLILDEILLKQLPDACLIVDLASVPGIDRQAAEKLRVNNIWARGLPGKLVPISAAAAIKRAVDAALNEWREPD